MCFIQNEYIHTSMYYAHRHIILSSADNHGWDASIVSDDKHAPRKTRVSLCFLSDMQAAYAGAGGANGDLI
jgi:hypothetical protein